MSGTTGFNKQPWEKGMAGTWGVNSARLLGDAESWSEMRRSRGVCTCSSLASASRVFEMFCDVNSGSFAVAAAARASKRDSPGLNSADNLKQLIFHLCIKEFGRTGNRLDYCSLPRNNKKERITYTNSGLTSYSRLISQRGWSSSDLKMTLSEINGCGRVQLF